MIKKKSDEEGRLEKQLASVDICCMNLCGAWIEESGAGGVVLVRERLEQAVELSKPLFKIH